MITLLFNPTTGAYTYAWKNAAEPLEESRKEPCSFCGEKGSTVGARREKQGWLVPLAHTRCMKAADAQAERIYAGLVDCPETRFAALRWVTAQ